MQVATQQTYQANQLNLSQHTLLKQDTDSPRNLRLQELAASALSEQNDSENNECNNLNEKRNFNSDSSKSSGDKQNKLGLDENLNYLSLKNIKSKEEIQIESKQNQEILLNLNFNIDDLFRKISCLTQEINTEIHNTELKQKPVSALEQQKNIIEKKNQKFNSKIKSLPFIDYGESVIKKEQSKNRKQYKPVFFQLNQKNNRQYSVNMKIFQTGKSLGCGKFGQVVECRNIKTNYLYALKKIFKSVIQEYGMENQLLTELKILTQIDHPNIVKAYQAFTDDFHIFILLEYVNGVLLTKKFKSSQSQVKIIIKQVLQAVRYLHEKKIAHRDIKPQNILLTFDNVVKICDFGWSSQQSEKMNILCGTLDYVSPEMANKEEYTQKIDLWNVGVLTYELIHGYPPFRSSSKVKMFEKVKNLEYRFSDQIQISQQCKQFITGFLKNETQRQSIQWGLNHNFLQIQQDNFEKIQIQSNLKNQFSEVLDVSQNEQ